MKWLFLLPTSADSYAHRTAVRKALAEDHDWVRKCFSRILPMFSKQVSATKLCYIPVTIVVHLIYYNYTGLS